MFYSNHTISFKFNNFFVCFSFHQLNRNVGNITNSNCINNVLIYESHIHFTWRLRLIIIIISIIPSNKFRNQQFSYFFFLLFLLFLLNIWIKLEHNIESSFTCKIYKMNLMEKKETKINCLKTLLFRLRYNRNIRNWERLLVIEKEKNVANSLFSTTIITTNFFPPCCLFWFIFFTYFLVLWKKTLFLSIFIKISLNIETFSIIVYIIETIIIKKIMWFNKKKKELTKIYCLYRSRNACTILFGA